MQMKTGHAAILGGSILLGLVALGFLLGNAAVQVKEYERSVRVKGLSEREFPADVVIWPIQFTVASNDLGELYRSIDQGASKIRQFLEGNGISDSEITVSAATINDKTAQQHGGQVARYRYSAVQTVTVYSRSIDEVRVIMGKLSEIGRQGVALTGDYYGSGTEYVFTRLNEVKPEMIEESTKKAREVAEKFAADSQSSLGKIKRASQGQFSISNRDFNNPHIKKVRVVSTIEYYLSD